jgi:hypothetical protein
MIAIKIYVLFFLFLEVLLDGVKEIFEKGKCILGI